MKAEILAVGAELLMGQIANTNAQYLSRRLADLGIYVYWHSVVGDNPERLKEALNLSLSRSDLVITTGGLGPTLDDLTKETIADALGRKLVLHEPSLQHIKLFFERVHKTMVASNEKQAWLPEGAIIIPNHYGTAPGCIIEEGSKVVVMLPGPPREMQPMFEETVFPYFEVQTGQVLASAMLKIFGIGESAMEMEILDIVQAQTNPTVAPYVGDGDLVLRVTAKAKTREEALELMRPTIDAIRARLGNAIFAENGETMEQIVGQLLIDNNLTISTAESCTGGLLSSKLVNVSGISKVFSKGYIVYANDAKVSELGVNPDVIERYGAVSMEVAREMAEGLRKKTQTDVSVAITGIAGPDGGTPEKPVGLVYVAVCIRDVTLVREFRNAGDRTRVRHMTALHALNMVREAVYNSLDDIGNSIVE